MPKKAKDELLEEKKNTKTKKEVTKVTSSKNKSTDSVAKKKSSATKKVDAKEKLKTSTTSKATTKTSAKEATKRSKTSSTVKKTTKVPTKNKTATKSTTKKSVATKKVTLKTLEYYDLPVNYEKTVVKILAQTPTSLFAYWEVSQTDKQNLIKTYGEDFFVNTYPVLLITNETMHYSFEVIINDYANSWYIPIQDIHCHYKLELIRKFKNTIQPSVEITSSNGIQTPNDHILFDQLGKTVFFKNAKTNETTSKDISSFVFMKNVGKIYNIYDLYKAIYKNELKDEKLGVTLSSSNFSSHS